MNIYTKIIICQILVLAINIIVKTMFVTAAIFMLLHGWTGCAVISMIGALLVGWHYDFKSEKPTDKQGKSAAEADKENQEILRKW